MEFRILFFDGIFSIFDFLNVNLMEEKVIAYNRRRGLLLAGLTIIVSIFWILGRSIDVYKYEVVGAIFEILWLPMTAMLVIVPLLCAIFWRNEQWYFRTLYPLCLVLHLIMVLFLVFGNTGK